MADEKNTVTTVDDYIAQFPTEIQTRLKKIREIIIKGVPEAKEKISYGMPSYALKRYFIHFAAQKNHIGIYVKPEIHMEIEDKLVGYKTTKSAIHFDNNKPVDYDFIKQIVTVSIKGAGDIDKK